MRDIFCYARSSVLTCNSQGCNTASFKRWIPATTIRIHRTSFLMLAAVAGMFRFRSMRREPISTPTHASASGYSEPASPARTDATPETVLGSPLFTQ